MNLEQELHEKIRRITPLNQDVVKAAAARQNALAKPLGSLGRLESLAIQVAGITGQLHNCVERRRLVVFSADNGVVEEGVSISPQVVTWNQTINLTRAKTGASVLAKHFGDELVVVDMGVNGKIPDCGVLDRKIAPGTRNLAKEDAMSREEALKAVLTGIELAEQAKRDGVQLLGTGEMGIGNTTTSSAVLAVLMGLSVEAVTGRGGGMTDSGFLHKKEIIERAIRDRAPDAGDPLDVLAKLGGFDIAGMAGLFLGGAINRIPVVIDGFISAVSALIAVRLCPDAAAFLIPSHASCERGYQIAMDEMGLQPILQLDMRLGEGSGCPLAFQIVSAACAVMNNMATFAEAEIDDQYIKDFQAQEGRF